MSIQAVNLFAPEWYTLKSEKDAEKPARVQLVGLDGLAQAELAAAVNFLAMEFELTPAAIAILIDKGVKGWENITDAQGNPLPFPDQVEDVQRAISYFGQVEIARRVFELTFLQPADKKK